MQKDEETSEKQKWVIVIEAPHVCVWPEVADPPCDMRTDDFARRLYTEVKTLKDSAHLIFDVFFLESDTPRSVCDMNRHKCRNEPYRQRLRKIIEQYAPNAFVIDVHSFEDTHNWTRGSRENQRQIPLQERPDVVLLDSDANPKDAENTALDYVAHIAHDLRNNTVVWRAGEHLQRITWLGLTPNYTYKKNLYVERHAPLVYVLAGAKENDVMVEMREKYNCKAVLVEFSQSLTGPSLTAIIKQIAKTAVNIVSASAFEH